MQFHVNVASLSLIFETGINGTYNQKKYLNALPLIIEVALSFIPICLLRLNFGWQYFL